MMAGMETYRFVGGSMDGREMETNGAHLVRVPIMRPIEMFSKVVQFRRSRSEPSIDIEEYQKFGRIYWWEGLVADAWCDMAVSDEALAMGGPAIRRVIRGQMRRTLEDMAAGKALHRIVWRVQREPYLGRHKVRALVGPRSVERGLHERSERRSGVPVVSQFESAGSGTA